VHIIFPDINGDDDEHTWNERVLLPRAGMSGEPAAQMRQIAEAMRDLRYVSGNAAILYHTGQLDDEQTIDYIMTYALATRERAQKSLQFISNPLFRSYLFTYTQGFDLIKQAAGNDELDLFRRLLSQQILPSQLAARAIVGTESQPDGA
jgi:hypothetical protein